MVIRMTTGGGRQLAAQHSHSLDGWYAHIPGIKVLAPAVADDFRWMLGKALADPDPVLIFEHGALYGTSGEVSRTDPGIANDRALIRRAGNDVTLVAYGGTLRTAIAAADELAATGIDAEVIDLRSLRPLDDATIMESVARTHHVITVDEGWRSGSLAAEVSARVVEQAFFDLDAPPGRVCTAEVPLPYPAHLEQAALPSPERVVAAVHAALEAGTT
jgi:pyruvate dehydrogenase E1 component beta subunit